MPDPDPKNLAAVERLRADAEALARKVAQHAGATLADELRQFFDDVFGERNPVYHRQRYVEQKLIAIQSACNQYVDLFDHLPVASFVMTREGAILEANHAAAAQIGVERDELIGHPLTSFLTTESQNRLQRQLQRASATGWKHSCELVLRRTDGSTFDLLADLTIRPPTRPEAPIGEGTVLVVGTDVTARNRAEKAVRLLEERYRGFFEGANDGFLALSEAWEVIESNPAACRLLGASSRALHRRTLWSLLAPDRADDLRARVLEEVGAPSPRPLELTLMRGDEQTFVVEAAVAAGAIEKGRVYYAVLRDVTTRGGAAEEPAGTWDRLQRAQKLEALGRLAGGLAHDIGNVLTAVNGLASAVLGDLPPESPLREDVEAILAANHHGGQITRQLLSFARRETPHRTALAPAKVIREVADLAARGAPPGVVFDLALDDSLVVEGDAGQLSQVFLNLFMNALDALPNGGTVRVMLLRAESPAGEALVRAKVIDSGEGMDAETRERAFEPFFTTKIDGKGSGLGLAMVYRLVRNHEGTVDIDSAQGVGTTVTVDLPLSARATKTEASASTSALRGAQVLVVDDEALVLAAIRRMLRPVGCEIETALGGRQALSLYEGDPSRFAVIVLDINMEGMDGIAVLDHLLTADPNVRVLLTSGGPRERIPERHRHLPNVRFLRKPFGPKELAALLSTLVQERPPPRA